MKDGTMDNFFKEASSLELHQHWTFDNSNRTEQYRQTSSLSINMHESRTTLGFREEYLIDSVLLRSNVEDSVNFNLRLPLTR